MIKTEVRVTGSVRPWEGPVENWQAHREVIEHWCEGGEVENDATNDCRTKAPPLFQLGVNYRKVQRKPKAGEVWLAPAYNEHGLYTEVIGMVSLQTGLQMACTNDIQYAAPSLAAYYARDFYSQSLIKDSGHDYEDAMKCLRVIKKAARLEQSDGS